MKIKEWIKQQALVKTLFWIIVTAIITLLCNKSCDRIMPNSPIVIKEVSDTVKVVHSYDFNSRNDSLTKEQLIRKLNNVKLAQSYEKIIINNNKKEVIYNPIMLDANFPNSKGYMSCDASAYFSLSVSSLQKEYIDFKMSFIDPAILNDIYCLSLKICRIENEKRISILDENYRVISTNHIRIVNNIPKGLFQIEVGFVFNKDINSKYPKFYNIAKMLKKE
ncbi:MAG: hypothetical protein WCR36_07605 [Bacteroidaceae bacterium]